MKRLFCPAILFGLLSLGLPSHLFGKSISDSMPSLSIDYSHQQAIYFHSDGITLSLANQNYHLLFGMSKQEIQSLLGEGRALASIHRAFFILESSHYHHLGITLHYHQNTLVLISISPGEEDNSSLLHLDNATLQLHQEYLHVQQKLIQIADQILSDDTFRINNNYIFLHKNHHDRLSVIQYASAFFRAYTQASHHHIIPIQLKEHGLIIQQQKITFGMQIADLEAILGKSDRYYHLQEAWPLETLPIIIQPKPPLSLQVLTYYHLASEFVFNEHGLIRWRHLLAKSPHDPALPIIHLYNDTNHLIFNSQSFFLHQIQAFPIIQHSQNAPYLEP